MVKNRKYFFQFVLFFIVLFSVSLQYESVYAKGTVKIEYELNGEEAIPGKECEVTLIITNVSDIDINDVLLTIGTSDKVYPVYGTSNQLYIKSIKSGESVNREYKFQLQESVTEVALLSVSAVYIDETGQNSANSLTFAIPVGKLCELSINEIYIKDTTYFNENTLLSIDYSNTGDVDIEELTMHLEGNIDNHSKMVPLGNLSVKRQNYKDTYILFYETGEQNLKVYFTYQDEKGTEYVTPVNDYLVTVEESISIPIPVDNYNSNEKVYTLLLFSSLLIILILIIKITSKLIKK